MDGPVRTTMSLSDLTSIRTPTVQSMMAKLPSGHDKALRGAAYNVIAVILAGVSILGLWGVYCILEPFIKSLLWALLCGSVLYPLKRKLVSGTKGWVEGVKESPVPFAVHLVASPLVIADSFSERIGENVVACWKGVLGGLASFFVANYFYYNPPVTLGLILAWIVTTVYSLIYLMSGLLRTEIVGALIIAYVGVVAHTLKTRYTHANSVNETKPGDQSGSGTGEPGEKSKVDEPDSQTSDVGTLADVSETEMMVLRLLSVVTWIVTLLYICMCLPITLMIPFVICMGAGALAYLKQSSVESISGSTIRLPQISLLATKLVLNLGKTQSHSSVLSRSHSFDVSSVRNSPWPPGASMSSPLIPASPRHTLRGTVLQKMADRTPAASHDRPDSTQMSSTPFEQGDVPKARDAEDNDDGAFHGEDEALIDSNKFLYGVFLACVVVQIWKHLWLAQLLPIPVVYYGIKRLCARLGLNEVLTESVKNPIVKFYTDGRDVASENVFPPPVRILLRILKMADQKLCEFCEAYIDPVASTVILVLVLLLTILFFVFAATQVYYEGDHLVRVTINLVNSTVSQYPHVKELLPENWENAMESMVGNAYVSGREYLTGVIRDNIEDKDPAKAREIEEQVVQLWDRLYGSWNRTWTSSEATKDVVNGEGGSGWNEFLETGKSVPKLLQYSALVDYAKANVGTLMSVMESIWGIVIGNISIAISAVMSLVSVLFGGGSAIVNLLVNFVIFLTALFYLLNSSATEYKPVELFRSTLSGNASGSGKYSSRFLTAVEESINSVFIASFKMSAFYGLWTYLTHSLFQINIVFVPSLLAALFGAVPLFSPYIASIPAVLEFLIQGKWMMSLLMFLMSLAPMSMVDTQIYSEIKGGGHPYLTGLAVAGGIFYFGMQGAIIGPVILCCVVVTGKLVSSFMREEHGPPHNKEE